MWKSNNQGAKEETFIQTGRRGRDRKVGWRGFPARRWLEDLERGDSSWWTGWPHICKQINWEEHWGARQTMQSRVLVQEKKASKPMSVKICGGCRGRRNCKPHKRCCWRDSQGPRMYTNLLTMNQHQKGSICLWVAGEVTESPSRAEKVALFTLWPLPHIQQ